MQHPADCTLCPTATPGSTHVYVDPETQARRLAAAREANERIHTAYHERKGPAAPCQRCEGR